MTVEAPEQALVTPAFLHRPPAARSMAVEVARVCASAGRTLDAEQRLAVDVCTGLKADGTPAALEAAIVSARQNLKTYALEGIALTLLLDPRNLVRLLIWSAQEFDTAQETFRNFADLFESPERFPHLARRVKSITRGSGKEQIELLGGRRLKFKARSGRSARGLTGDAVFLDEAFALDAAHMGALLPTLSTRRRAMVFYGSSAGLADSAILRGVRDRGRRGGPGAPAYVEWCAPGSLDEPGCEIEGCPHVPGTVGCSLDREDFWLMANPAMGRRITVEYLRTERGALPPLEFARERLGWWDAPDAPDAPPITAEAWRSRLDPQSAVADGGAVVFSPEIAMSRGSGSIAVAGWRDDGAAHVGLVEHRAGTDWMLARTVELAGAHRLHKIMRGKVLCDGIVIDPTSPAGTLIDGLRAAGLEPVLLTAREVAAGCGGLQDAVRDETVWHRGQPQVDVAIQGAARRDLGDGGWAWGRRRSAAGSGADITPVVALTNARWGLTQAAAVEQPFFASRR